VTKQRIAELRALAEAATPGPWVEPDDFEGIFVKHAGPGYAQAPGGFDWLDIVGPNAAFIAAARTALPEALDAIKRVREMCARAEAEVYHPGETMDGNAPFEPGMIHFGSVLAALDGTEVQP